MPDDGPKRTLCVAQVLPALHEGGVERGTLDVAATLVEAGHGALVISGGGRMVKDLAALGAEHIELPVGAKSPWTLRLVPRLRRLLEERRVDVVHARSRLPAWIAYFAVRKMAPAIRPRFVTTVHGLYSVNAYSAIMTRGDRVIAVSETVRDYVHKNYPGVPHELISVIHRGVDRNRFPFGYRPPTDWLIRWGTDLPNLDGRIIVTLPARLTRWKGQEDFVDVIGRLIQLGLPVHGLIVGGHDSRRQAYVDELKDKINRANLAAHITMLGHRGDLREIMSVSNVVLSLSRDPEAFGRTTIEALSLGRPVCGYGHGGVDEQLRAILPEGSVAVGDVEAVAQRIQSWYRKPPTIARDHPFTLQRMVTETLTLYADLTSEIANKSRGLNS